MAASPRGSIEPNNPLLSRSSMKPTHRINLPTGPCNYINLSVGGNAPRCGCRRFWKRTIEREAGSGEIDATGWCMCEHHACFHEHGDKEVVESITVEETVVNTSPQISGPPHPNSRDRGLSPRNSLPDSLQWFQLLNSASNLESGLPSIPSQCLLSENVSMTSLDQARYLLPFAGIGLETLSHIPKPLISDNLLDAKDKDMRSHRDLEERQQFQSPAKVSMSMDMDVEMAVENISTGTVLKAMETAVTLRSLDEASQSQGPDLTDAQLLPRMRSLVADYSTRKENHERRLDLLENASFSYAGLEDLEENLENLDTRVAELEERVLDIEKTNTADQLSLSGRHQDSVISNSSAGDYDLVSRLHNLEAQVANIQAFVPSYAHPWEVEVVLLPFGPRLTGMWSSDLSLNPPSRGDENPKLKHSLLMHDQAPSWREAVLGMSCHPNQPWLMPKACGPRSKVYERLKSRGLVKTIQICGPGYRDVQAAVKTAFGEPFSLLGSFNHNDISQTSLKPYQGLSNQWIPLRKFHKTNCLRFLDPTEMLTPTLWNVSFLYSSVAMRMKRVRRLYLTQPDSYIQYAKNISDWTWHELRQLPRFYPNVQSSFGHTPEADAQEECWEHSSQLDSSPSTQSSATPQVSLGIVIPHDAEASFYDRRSRSREISAHDSATPTSSPHASTLHQHLSLSQERQPFRPIHTRTTSLPSIIPPRISKRQIGSFKQEPQSPPHRPASAVNLKILKRRRISRSPSIHARNIPRHSGLPSPYTDVNELLDRKRLVTPPAYATPYSNAPYLERPHSDLQGEDSITDEIFPDEDGSCPLLATDPYDERDLTYEHTLVGNAYDANSNSRTKAREEEWEGVQDDSHSNLKQDIGGSREVQIFEDAEEDEDLDSETSSLPSEYPSTEPRESQKLRPNQPIAFSIRGGGFRIHIDEEDGK